MELGFFENSFTYGTVKGLLASVANPIANRLTLLGNGLNCTHLSTA